MTETPATIAVKYLGTLWVDIGARSIIEDGPQGTRSIANVVGGRFEGARIKARVEPPAGDWITMRRDGTYKLDVRFTLMSDDGAVILMTYNGIGQLTDTGSSIRMAPLFETGDERYAWLNRLQAVGVGGRVGLSRVEYDVYALL